MTGLEKILKAIDDEAQARADEIINEGKKQADEILSAAKQEADQKCAEIAQRTSNEIKSIISRAESAAALFEKKAILEAKQKIIAENIKKARESLSALSDDEYTETVIKLIKRYAHCAPGQILFSASDKKRLPVDFFDKVNLALKEKKGASLILADKSADIDGGFLLVYGDIEENCSFDALFEAAREDLQDKVNFYMFD